MTKFMVEVKHNVTEQWEVEASSYEEARQTYSSEGEMTLQVDDSDVIVSAEEISAS